MTAPRALLLILGAVLIGVVVIAALQRPGPTQELANEFGTEAGRLRQLPRIDMHEARFSLCDGPVRVNCVVDGDTFWFEGQKYRLADIDTPETHPPRCAQEARLGTRAIERLRDWLNSGAFRLEENGRDSDRYGRKLRIATRDGVSVGSVLINAGLARPWEGYRRPWC